jgi:chromosome segregation ATPase
MPKFAAATEYAPEPVELSPSRAALRDLNTARAAAATEVETLHARVGKLAKLKESVATLESELSQTLAADGKQLEDWAMSDTGEPAPQPDSTKRLALEAKLADAVSQARAADAATISVEHALNTANAKAARLESEIPAAVAAALLDEARALLPGVVEATAELAKARGRYASLRDFLLTRAEAARDIAARNGFFRDLELLDKEAAGAASIGPLLSFSVGNEWRDPARELGDTPARSTKTRPAVFNLPAEDKWINS